MATIDIDLMVSGRQLTFNSKSRELVLPQLTNRHGK
jgi:hypothetical protein